MAVKKESLLNYARNSRLVLTVTQRYMVKVYNWLYKGSSLELVEFLKQRKVFKQFTKCEQEKIKKTPDVTSLDVTFIYKLLLYACDIPFENPKWHTSIKEGEKPSLGQILYKVKNIRNKEIHKEPGKLTQVSDYSLDVLTMELTQLLTQMLTLAGREAGKHESVIAEEISNMTADVLRERHAKDGITAEEFVALGRQELLNQEAPKFSYVEPRLVVQTLDASYGSIIPLSELFNTTFPDGSKPQIIHVTGEAGAGKTSLCQALMAWWLKEEPEAEAIAEYQLLLCVTCARVKSRDLHRHLRTWTLPKTTRLCDNASLTQLLWEAKVLWLVDGWDEATREAKGLLQEILHSMGKSHTVLATCRPELSSSLADNFCEKKFFKVCFSGLQRNEMEELVRGLNLPGVEHQSLERFLNYLHSFPIEEQKELNNPLKLQLMAQMWFLKQGNIGGCRSLSFVHVYFNMIDCLRLDLISRCKEDAAPGQDVEPEIDAWLKCLYKVSFASAKSDPSLILDEKHMKSLFQDFGVPTSFCLSTFLECTPVVGASHRNFIHSFSHDTQRCAYAARHLECCCKDAANPEAKLRQLLEVESKEMDDHINPYHGMYDLVTQFLLMVRILLFIITCGWICHDVNQENLFETVLCLARKFIHLVKGVHLPIDRWIQASSLRSRLVPVLLQVMEMWANSLFEVRVSAKFLVDLFASLLEGDSDPGRWLEVVRRCGMNDELVREVSQKISTKLWVINDGDVRAAVILLQYVTSRKVKVVVSDDPKKVSHLYELLSKLAEQRVELELHILNHYHGLGSRDFSDTYLELVCRPQSKCLLTAFSGHLNACSPLRSTSALRLISFNLRITQLHTLSKLTAVTQKLLDLKTLNLFYDNKKFIVPDISFDNSISRLTWKPRYLEIHLLLPHLCETSVNAAVDFISGLNKQYVSLRIGKLDQRGIKKLMAGLKNNAVYVGHFMISIYFKEYTRNILVDLGSLPIQVPLGDFLRHLHDLFKNPFKNIVSMKRM